jgi:hypothetical protein
MRTPSRALQNAIRWLNAVTMLPSLRGGVMRLS